ncbi:MAG TPA: hypothetical protein VNM87_14875 [Candidatus Udaeobacter sp.]|nr:hypothetical protein [Candidatus Udaeobacter sp.]
MPFIAVRTQVETVRQYYAARQALRRELDGFARAGERIAAGGQAGSAAQSDLLAQIRPIQAELAELATQIERARVADRKDYGAVSPGMRPLVVTRGLCERMVLRDRMRQGRRALRPLFEQLGATAGVEPATAAAMTPAISTPATARLATGAAKEGLAFGVAFVKQLQSTLIPRAPALAGLAVGWWIARTYTDSRWRSVLHRIGFGDGGTKVVSSDTLQAMHFWLPILAAAICAYLGDRIARRFRRRYEPSAG